MKRGQISVFIIIGIVIILGTLIYIFMSSPPGIEQPNNIDLTPASSHTKDCVRKTAIDAVKIIGKQGMISPTAYLVSKDTKIAYYYFKGKSFFPPLTTLEQEIETYIRENIDVCVLDLKGNNLGIRSVKVSSLNISIQDEVEINFIGSINIRDDITNATFDAVIDSNLGKMNKAAEEIIKDTQADPEWINLEGIAGMDSKIIKIDSSTLVYVLSDPTGLEGETYNLMFGMKYDFGK
ncbi:MAG: hypothetical protein ABIJ34_06145 [archaeon]